MWKKAFFLIIMVFVVAWSGKVSAELVARYSFDDGAASDSAYYYTDADGTFYGDAAVVDDPCRGLVLTLDGILDYVKVHNTAVANFSTESFTYTFWVKTATPGTWFYFWKGKDLEESPPSNLHGVNCYHDNSEVVRFSLYNYQFAGDDDDGKSRTEVPEANCVNGQWVHIGCVREAGEDELRFYVNGQLEPGTTEELNPAPDDVHDVSNTGSLYIGCNDRGNPDPNPTLFFTGMFDDFRAYNHALTEQELEDLCLGELNPNLASAPVPSDGAQNACPDVILGWTAGQGADSHDVYFGTDPYAVKAATTSSDEFMENTGSNSYDPTGLVQGATYYWRIDEVDGGQKAEGPVWKFRVNDGKAHSPDPTDAGTLVPVEQVLSWTAGCFASSHDVYFGTDFDSVHDATTATSDIYKGDKPVLDTDYNPGGLDYSTVYYWRIDEVDGATTWTGDVWSFTAESVIFDADLRVWYKLDETEGIDAADSSGREYDGVVVAEEEPGWDPDGRFGGCCSFDDDGHISIPTAVLGEIDKEISISVWLNNSGLSGGNVACAAGAPWEDTYLMVEVPGDLASLSWRAGDDTNDVLEWSGGDPASWVDNWTHFVFIKDENQDEMKIYVNAEIADQKTGIMVGTLAGLRNRAFKIGAEAVDSSSFEGKVDDFRVYDRVLTPLQITSLFRGGEVELAWLPRPSNGERDVTRDSTLTWRPGDYVDLHDVYFGTSFDDVNDADTTSDVYVDRRGPNEYAPPTDLAMNTTYYWRIDEVNTTDPNLWKGAVWTFKVANFIVVDSFETYTSSNDMYLKWKDGWENDTGSTLLLSAPGDPTHGADKSQLYSYNNMGSPYYSEAERVLGAGEQDFTEAGVEILTMYFYGKSTNTATTKEQLYAGLDDGGTYVEVRYGTQEGESITDIQIEDWTEWNVDLNDFTDVTLSSVDSLFVGFGSRSASSAGGNGLVYFDDIRLYPSRCIPAKGLMDADLSGNCVIDIADVGIMGMQWLLTDVNFPNRGITVTEPSTTNLVGFWKLEGNGNDSSGKGNNGTPEGTYSWVTGYDGVNQAIELVNGRVLVPDHATLRPASVVSAACWVYYDGNPGGAARVVVKGPDNFEAYCIEMASTYQFTFYVGDVNGIRYWADSDEGDVRPGEWMHLGGTYDGTTVKSYVNGLVVGTEEANSIPLCQDTNGLAIGNRSDANDRPFTGIVDEVRVYNIALSQAEMAWLATDGTGYVPLRSTVNIYDEEPQGSRAINFRDVAELMLSWLDEKLWPRDY